MKIHRSEAEMIAAIEQEQLIEDAHNGHDEAIEDILEQLELEQRQAA